MKNRIIKCFFLFLTICILMGCCSALAFGAEKEPVNLVVIGDSIAAGTKLFNADVQCYGAILAKTNGWNYTNFAVPGHTTYAFNERIQEDEVKAAIADADIITVSIGGNNFLLNGLVDMVADGLLKDDYTKMDEIMEAFYVSFDECIRDIKAINPEAELFVQTLYNPMPGIIGDVYAEGQKRLNKAYKSYLDSNPGAYTLVDIEPLFEGHMDYIATDFIHPNKTGHTVIAKAYQQIFFDMGLTDTNTVTEPSFSEIISIDLMKTFKDLWFQLTNAVKLAFGGLANG